MNTNIMGNTDVYLDEVKLIWDPVYKYWRIKDKHGDFLGLVLQDLSICIYCKKCKVFFKIPISVLLKLNSN